jgi:hypothetical protein
LEIFGGKWSLLIVRDIVFFGKKTYGQFPKSEEGKDFAVSASTYFIFREQSRAFQDIGLYGATR